MSWKPFAARLIETGELDVNYTVLNRAFTELGDDWVSRLCLYMLMFYDMEGAITAADKKPGEFWDHVLTNYPNLKRGQERRHYRGQNGLNSIKTLMVASPEVTLHDPKARTYPAFYREVRSRYNGFGEYTVLKWADFLDAVFEHYIDFTQLAPLMFSGATRGLEYLWPGRGHREGLAEITDFIKQFPAPFAGGRPCGNSEAETISCGWASYVVKAAFPIGYDIAHLRALLKAHPSPKAKIMLEFCPDEL